MPSRTSWPAASLERARKRNHSHTSGGRVNANGRVASTVAKQRSRAVQSRSVSARAGMRACGSVSERNTIARDGSAVEAVAPRLPTLTQFAPAPPGTHPNDDLNLDLTLRGSYARVMRVVRTLDGRTAAVRLTVANLRVARLLPGSPTEIDATFHVTLLGADADATTPPVQHPS